MRRFGGSEFKPASVPTSSSHEMDPFGDKYCSEPGRFFGNSSIEMAYLAASCPQSRPQEMPTASQLPRAACLWVSGTAPLQPLTPFQIFKILFGTPGFTVHVCFLSWI